MSAEMDRRVSLKLLASAMAATMAGCSRPEEEIIPYANMPEGLVAGEPMRFATTLSLCGYGRGMLGISVDGHPIKIEGNPRHPFSLGATDIFSEAEVLSLYDLDRSRVPQHKDQIANWDDFIAAWGRIETNAAVGLVTGRVVSPTTLLRLAALQRRYPNLRRYRYEPVNDDAERAGARQAFGRNLSSQPRWEDADIVLCLAADPLGHGPGQMRIARAFATRVPRARLYVVEPLWTLTGAAADFRLALRPEMSGEIGRAVANALGADLGAPALSAPAKAFADRAATELMAHKGRALVLAGPTQPPDLHALCHWLNQKLGAPLSWAEPLDQVEADHGASLSQLAGDAHKLDALVIADCNPVYDAPDGLHMEQAIAATPFSAHLGRHRDETAAVCGWHLPLSHALESWGDARAPDGTASLVQPLIRTLYDTRTSDEFLALLANEPVTRAYELTRATWRDQAQGDFETWWRGALHDGVIAGSAAQAVTAPTARAPNLPKPASSQDLALVMGPHPSVWDGRFANNAWLQECPAPFTKEVWGNALQVAPEDAARLGLNDGDTVELSVAGQTITAPAAVMTAQAEGVVGASWGQGREKAGKIGSDVGVRVSGLGPKPLSRLLAGARLRKSAESITYRSTQAHTRLRGRAEDLFQIANGKDQPEAPPPSLLPVPPRGEYAWAMVVDTNACIGCNACVVACQAENNVPVVGPEEVSEGRDMHWLRVDAYARPEGGKFRQGFQPVPCMHCELAPCEPVCPVEASVHDHQGLNVQVYNRCIGTRFCEANCPYKVRRFNWFAYSGEQAYADLGPALKAQHNPDVSARGRGVMEKCNYCLQRVNRARRNAEKENRTVAEGEMVTACQAACPTRAIHFGDLNRADSDVSRLRGSPRHYTLLAELNTRPRTTYLKRVYGAEDEE